MEERSAPEIVFSAQRGALAAFLRGLFTGDGSVHFEAANGEESFLEYASASRRLVEDLHHLLLRFGIFARIRREVFAPGHPLYRLQIAGPLDIRRFAQEIGFLPGSLKQTLLGELLSQLPAEAHRPGFQALRSPALKEPVLAGTTFRAPTSFSQPSYEPNLLNTVHAEEEELVWDGVVSIQPAGVEPVYDLTVPEASNFLANDLIVHNSTYARCGIIVNVTPFEPEWEGFVTLEISNTTPLPAKIYANEGIAQVLFFEGDEECETSYADKKGKYQGQQSIVLPKL
jgi:intein/homing endonuclease